MPAPNLVNPWLEQIAEALCNEGIRHDDMEIAWLFTVKDKTFDELYDSNLGGVAGHGQRWHRADAAIAKGLRIVINKLNNSLTDRVRRISTSMMTNRKLLRGRQLVRMVLEHLKDGQLGVYHQDISRPRADHVDG